MKNSIKQFGKILIVLFVCSFIMACPNRQYDENQEHSDHMHDSQPEMMDGDNHMDDNLHSDEHMMNDTTSMKINEEMEQ